MVIGLDKSIYDKMVFLKTANAFTAKAYVHLSQTADEWLIDIKPKSGINIEPAEFENELIAQQLRHELVQNSSDLRTIIMARALASTVVDTRDAAEINESNETDAEDETILKGWYDQHE